MIEDIDLNQRLRLRLRARNQLLHLLPVFVGSQAELHTHTKTRVHAQYFPMDPQSEILGTHHNLQTCSAGKRLRGLQVTTAWADVDQSAAGWDFKKVAPSIQREN